MNFYHGATRIVEKAGRILTVPLAIRYEFLGEFKPEIFVQIAAPQAISADTNFAAKALTEQFERRLTETLDGLKNDVLTKTFDDYEKIV